MLARKLHRDFLFASRTCLLVAGIASVGVVHGDDAASLNSKKSVLRKIPTPSANAKIPDSRAIRSEADAELFSLSLDERSDVPSTSSVLKIAPTVKFRIDPVSDARELEQPSTSAETTAKPRRTFPVQTNTTLSGMHSGAVEGGYSSYPPTSPSAISPMLRYLTCDPYSCPNVWAGIEAQRAAELAARCSRGHGCFSSGVQLYSTPCDTCSTGGCLSPMNRYRQSPAACDSCDQGSAVVMPPVATSGCASCGH